MVLRERFENERQKDKAAELAEARHEAMINAVMDTRIGRDFVRYVLNCLMFQQPNSAISAHAYKVAALQDVALSIYKEIYSINTDMCELMMREGKKNG